MDETKLNKLSYILFSESNAEAVELVKSINSEDELFVLLDNYKWDNGFEVQMQLLIILIVLSLLPYQLFIEQTVYNIYLKERLFLQIVYRNPGKIL